ncbi:protein of unknown function [Methylorubrum extorquens]|uniref:Uncharacterized protein n=1 Tax=Methylorubrum extorquens TaxID=408 RepID=A0A2N9AN85_METEX|nr:protein of unknown function [Methylorubrum extorquens]
MIEQNGGELALGGIAVSESDARLVYAAWQCDPHPFRDLPPDREIERIQRSITIRQMLEQASRGEPA